ncbi:hypothetical protein K469DRAFT_699948 [Zopfia rhizophila CBS 207.26]|uniref:Uncharacterized protein n=1 Tax=Zopfia rhizophila CBS 207.26 TaxID=1314779 RepID=A0A6A6EI23_9PEZI|nr:hypothetical protein K469DRAFT_699948 [Zopfia rhizophila CBS 207.26]
MSDALRWMSTKNSYIIKDVAKMFNVDYRRLLLMELRRSKNPSSRSTRQKTNQKLTPAQLKALELYIKCLDDLGQPSLVEIGNQEIITLDVYRVAESPSNTERELITLVEAINAIS